MRKKSQNALKFIFNYFRILLTGYFHIYKLVFLKIAGYLRVFSLLEIIYYLFVISSLVFSSLGWRGYEIAIYEDTSYHTISNDDFLFFLFGTILMSLPAFFKVFSITRKGTIAAVLNLSGLLLNTVFFILNFIFPSRISSTPIASFTIWFYLYGLNLIILWVLSVRTTGIPGIVMPSIHSRS